MSHGTGAGMIQQDHCCHVDELDLIDPSMPPDERVSGIMEQARCMIEHTPANAL